VFTPFSCRTPAERLDAQIGQTIAEVTVAVAVLASGILLAISVLAAVPL
jgi:hypothetical protein